MKLNEHMVVLTFILPTVFSTFVGYSSFAQSKINKNAPVLMAALAKVGVEVLTTRDLQIHQFINESEPLFNDYIDKKEPLKTLVWESLIYSESKTTLNQTVSETEIKDAAATFAKKYAKDKLWTSLSVSERDLNMAMERHQSAKKLMGLKMPTDLISITDKEVENYYAQNKAQLGHRPLEESREQIRKGLKSIKARERFSEWMRALTRTHSVEYFSGVQVK